jgi:hypothetical protein
MGRYSREARGEFEGTKGTDGLGCSTVGLPFLPFFLLCISLFSFFSLSLILELEA